jgi:hypothetical protein
MYDVMLTNTSRRCPCEGGARYVRPWTLPFALVSCNDVRCATACPLLRRHCVVLVYKGVLQGGFCCVVCACEEELDLEVIACWHGFTSEKYAEDEQAGLLLTLT